MIHLAVKEYCQSCPYFSSDYRMITKGEYDRLTAQDTAVVCEHEPICNRLEKIFTGEISPPL